MKRMGHWSWVVGACVLELGMGSIAIASGAIPQIHSGQILQLSQGLQGQCRQAYENIFIYRTRSPSEPISSVVRDELVILAEDSARDGWIAVSSPTTGFVQARFLKLCDRAGTVYAAPPPLPRPELPPLPSPTLSPSIAPPLPRPAQSTRIARPNNLPASSLCRRVTYPESEGMTVRSGPSVDFARVGGVFFNDRVTINPNATQLDSQGRQWLRAISPVNGWISNGFPALGESNFGACF